MLYNHGINFPNDILMYVIKAWLRCLGVSIDASPISTNSPLLIFISLEPRLVLAEYTFIKKNCIWLVLVGCFILAIKITWQRDIDHSRIKICVILIARISIAENRNCRNYVIIWINHDWVCHSQQLPRVLFHNNTNPGLPVQHKERFHKKMTGNDTIAISSFSLLDTCAMIHATNTRIILNIILVVHIFRSSSWILFVNSLYIVYISMVVKIINFISVQFTQQVRNEYKYPYI